MEPPFPPPYPSPRNNENARESKFSRLESVKDDLEYVLKSHQLLQDIMRIIGMYGERADDLSCKDGTKVLREIRNHLKFDDGE